MTKKVGMKIPKTIGQCADLLYKKRQQRLDKQGDVDALKADETKLKEHLIQNLNKNDSNGAAGRIAKAFIVKKNVPSVKDWTKFHKYVHRTKQFDLLPRSVAKAAVKERWDDGKKIPGVEAFTTVTVSVTKL